MILEIFSNLRDSMIESIGAQVPIEVIQRCHSRNFTALTAYTWLVYTYYKLYSVVF